MLIESMMVGNPEKISPRVSTGAADVSVSAECQTKIRWKNIQPFAQIKHA